MASGGTHLSTNSSVPILDIGDLLHGEGRTSLLRDIACACEEWGCFQVVHHGVPRKVVESMWATALQFYEQPNDVKQQRNATKERLLGMNYMPFDMCTNALEIVFVRRRPGICDGFKESVEWFGDSIKEFAFIVERLANNLYTAIFESLGLEAEYCKVALPSIERAVLTLNFYPPGPHASKPDLAFKVHSDVGTLTIIIQDDVGGLQAQSPKTGEWVSVDYQPDVFYVLLGDQIEILSNGKYKACRHRVLANTSGRLRMSTPFTFGPREEDLIQPLPKLINSEDERLFRGVVFREYMARYLDVTVPSSETGLNFAKITYTPPSD